MVKLVILDLDGTLISERTYIYGCFQAVSSYLEGSYGIRQPYEKLTQLFEAEWNQVFHRLFEQEKISVTEAEIQATVTQYRQAEPRIFVYPDVVPFLRCIKAKGIRSLIVTNGYAKVQQRKLELSGLERQTDGAIIPDRYGREYWKPDVRCLREVMKRWEADGADAVFIGDGNVDFQAAQALGVRMLHICRDDCVSQFSYKGQAEEIGSLEEALFLIEKG